MDFRTTIGDREAHAALVPVESHEASANLIIGDAGIPRRTISTEIAFEGIGIHSGDAAKVILRPSGAGFVWKLTGKTLGVADFNYTDTHTTVARFSDGDEIICTEHLLSALYLHEISDVEIDISGGKEIPFLDGSGLDFYLAIKDRVTSLSGPLQRQVSIQKPHIIHGRDGKGYIILLPAHHLSVECTIDYPMPIGAQYSKLSKLDDPEKVISARSFIRDPLDRIPLQEAAKSRLRGLPEVASSEALILWDSHSVLTTLRHENEFATHKIVDLLGDLYTINHRLRLRIIAHRPGHELNRRAAEFLFRGTQQ
ncbi:UDP-3-O-acyl-N-acetylglucosamine deacetylase [Sinorhizobium medicae]|uniref:UDP-3-O-acyl-N-acetylglucosamine deacetylase n=1 Tax=Sinorhizobium medicae TaxID=110321 RepID=UPI00186571CE|nr:UDP-3-O-acyl-N-acetylglucosamine deacetylase [Sinorhizobium medicae]